MSRHHSSPRALRHRPDDSDAPPTTLRDPRASSGGVTSQPRRERESGPQLKAASAHEQERPTLPYRYAVGDIAGALAVGLPLLDEDHVPAIVMPEVVLSAIPLSGREEYVLSLVDGWSTMAELVESSSLSTLDTLRTFCELVEKGILGLR